MTHADKTGCWDKGETEFNNEAGKWSATHLDSLLRVRGRGEQNGNGAHRGEATVWTKHTSSNESPTYSVHGPTWLTSETHGTLWAALTRWPNGEQRRCRSKLGLGPFVGCVVFPCVDFLEPIWSVWYWWTGAVHCPYPCHALLCVSEVTVTKSWSIQWLICVPFVFFKEEEDIYFMKGAFEEVIRYCTLYNNGGISLPLTPQQQSFCQQEEKKMGSLGLRGQCLWPQPWALNLHVALYFSSAFTRGPESVRWLVRMAVGQHAGGSKASVKFIGEVKGRIPPLHPSHQMTPINLDSARVWEELEHSVLSFLRPVKAMHRKYRCSRLVCLLLAYCEENPELR